jgi:hypothetical protein
MIGLRRYDGWERRHDLALAVGLTHFVLGFGLQLYARQGLPGVYLVILGTALASLGLVITGALPVLLWESYRLVLPGIATVGWFAWGLYGTWAIRRSLPYGAFDGINWNTLPPYPDYMMKVNLLLIGLVILAGVELLVRKGVWSR